MPQFFVRNLLKENNRFQLRHFLATLANSAFAAAQLSQPPPDSFHNDETVGLGVTQQASTCAFATCTAEIQWSVRWGVLRITRSSAPLRKLHPGRISGSLRTACCNGSPRLALWRLFWPAILGSGSRGIFKEICHLILDRALHPAPRKRHTFQAIY